MSKPAAETLEREKDKLSAEYVRGIFSYDPEEGVFRRMVSGFGCEAGSIAGHQRAQGYIRIKIDHRRYYAHRLAWLFVYGEWPPHEVDHVNGDPSDNRISNLRLATHRENMANVKKHRDNGSGLKGAYPTAHNRWCAKIMRDGKIIRLGNFKTQEEAHAAYCAKARELFGQFGRSE